MASPTVDELLDMIARRDRDRMIDALAELAALDGFDAVVSLLAAVQREVGSRWEDQSWSIADEHAATATVDLALAAAALRIPAPEPPRGRVVVACAEEEWHVLPGRMLAEQLRARRWDVTFLGGSIPSDHLGAYLATHRPLAVALSCSIPIHLPGAWRSIDAARAAGVPVIAGGAAFGGTARRARAIGADAWAATVGAADATLSEWAAHGRPAPADPADDSAQRELAGARPEYVGAAMARLPVDFPTLATFSPWQLGKTREDFDYILRFIEAALLTGDDNIVIDFVQWLARLLEGRGLPRGIVAVSMRCLLAVVPETDMPTRRLLELAERTDRAAHGTP